MATALRSCNCEAMHRCVLGFQMGLVGGVCISGITTPHSIIVCRVGVWFGFVRSALLLSVVTCIVLSLGPLSGLCCFLRVTHSAV